PAVRDRVGAHAPVALRGQRCGQRDGRAVVVEQLIRAVFAQPALEDAHVLFGVARVRERHLVRAVGAFDLHAVDEARARPAFGRAQDDHRPGWRVAALLVTWG